jgi:hypothetical protein
MILQSQTGRTSGVIKLTLGVSKSQPSPQTIEARLVRELIGQQLPSLSLLQLQRAKPSLQLRQRAT